MHRVPHRSPYCRFVIAMLMLTTITAPKVRAQVVPQVPSAQASRAELESFASALERSIGGDSLSGDTKHSATAQLERIHQRLRDGDFAPGDRVVIRVGGDSTLNGDTLIVNGGRMLDLGGLGMVPLQGVLRSELREQLVAHVSRYFRNPQVAATPLLRVAVFGRVANPGYYSIAPESPIGDAIMLAGGPGPDADMQKIDLRRGDDVLLSPSAMREALARGITLDQLDVRAGDAINIGERKQRNMTMMIQTLAVILGSVTAAMALSRR